MLLMRAAAASAAAAAADSPAPRCPVDGAAPIICCDVVWSLDASKCVRAHRVHNSETMMIFRELR